MGWGMGGVGGRGGWWVGVGAGGGRRGGQAIWPLMPYIQCYSQMTWLER